MDFFVIIEKVVIFTIFIACMVAIAAFIKRYKLGNIALSVGKESKLRLDEMMIIDSNNKVVVVSYENYKYILHLGSSTAVLDKIKSFDKPIE